MPEKRLTGGSEPVVSQKELSDKLSDKDAELSDKGCLLPLLHP
jgi:hypothetical protein